MFMYRVNVIILVNRYAWSRMCLLIRKLSNNIPRIVYCDMIVSFAPFPHVRTDSVLLDGRFASPERVSFNPVGGVEIM